MKPARTEGRDPAVGPRVCSSLGAGSHLVCVAAILSVMWCMIRTACGGECRKGVRRKHFSQCWGDSKSLVLATR